MRVRCKAEGFHFISKLSDLFCTDLFCFSFSLFGVCLMAFHQAQYILNEFSTPSVRSNHNSVLPRENGSNNTPNGVTYVQRSF